MCCNHRSDPSSLIITLKDDRNFYVNLISAAGQVKTMKSLLKHEVEAPNYNANTRESFPSVGL